VRVPVPAVILPKNCPRATEPSGMRGCAGCKSDERTWPSLLATSLVDHLFVEGKDVVLIRTARLSFGSTSTITVFSFRDLMSQLVLLQADHVETLRVLFGIGRLVDEPKNLLSIPPTAPRLAGALAQQAR